MEVVKIRQKVILDAMLNALDLPESTSETVTNMDGTVIVTVTFFPSARWFRYSNLRHSCESATWDNVRDAENEAVHEAIQYMECVLRKTPKDYNHGRLQNKQESDACLLLELAKKDQEIRYLANSWCSFIGDVRVASEKVEKILRRNLGDPRYENEQRVGSELLELEKATTDLKHLALQSAELFEATGRPIDGELIHNTDQ